MKDRSGSLIGFEKLDFAAARWSERGRHGVIGCFSTGLPSDRDHVELARRFGIVWAWLSC